MVGIMWIIILAIIGGIVAFVGDKIGSKVGKKRLSIFGLRPYHTSIIMTIFTGIVIVAVTITTLATLSTDVHTALFDMNEIRAEIGSLNIENEKAIQEVNSKNEKIKQLDEKIKEATMSVATIQKTNDELETKLKENELKNEATERTLQTTKNEVAALNKAKEILNATIEKSKKAIAELEDSMSNLENSIMAVREGEVIFRSDEIVFAGVLNGSTNKKEAEEQFAKLAIDANAAVLKRLGIEKETQIVYLAKAEVEQTISLLQVTSTPLYIRINAAGNTINGEPVLAKIKTYEEKVIYNKGNLICEETINLKRDNKTLNQALADFFKKLNKSGIEKGLIPDPISGQVGQIPIATVREAADDIKKADGTVILKAYAKDRIMTSGPLIPRLEVDSVD